MVSFRDSFPHTAILEFLFAAAQTRDIATLARKSRGRGDICDGPEDRLFDDHVSQMLKGVTPRDKLAFGLDSIDDDREGPVTVSIGESVAV